MTYLNIDLDSETNKQYRNVSVQRPTSNKDAAIV